MKRARCRTECYIFDKYIKPLILWYRNMCHDLSYGLCSSFPMIDRWLLYQSVQFSVMSSSLRPHGLSITNSQGLPKLTSIELVISPYHLSLCCPLLLPPIFPSIRGFSNESALHIRWPKYWTFSFISPSNEHLGLISFRMDWLDLLAVQGTLKSLLQHHSSKASILQHSAFLIVRL